MGRLPFAELKLFNKEKNRMLRVFGSRERNARGLLMYALHQTYGLNELPPIARLPKGKPWFPSASHIHFSLSHSGGFALCAVGNGEVGVDIETVRPRRTTLPQFALTAAEHDTYLRNGGTWEAFYALWTRKEAWCKYTGEGLPAHPSELHIPTDVFLHSYAGDGWRCAVCAMQPPPELEWID
jgi:4'-phosphopantetheinyl transferase